MSLQTRLEAVIAAIGADVKALQQSGGSTPAPFISSRVVHTSGDRGPLTSTTWVSMGIADIVLSGVSVGDVVEINMSFLWKDEGAEKFADVHSIASNGTTSVNSWGASAAVSNTHQGLMGLRAELVENHYRSASDTASRALTSNDIVNGTVTLRAMWRGNSAVHRWIVATGDYPIRFEAKVLKGVKGDTGATGSATAASTMDIEGEYITGAPAAPSLGARLFTRVSATRRLPAFIGPSGLDMALQPHLGSNKVALWTPVGGSGGAIATAIGWNSASVGTATARVISTGGNLFNSLRRLGYASAATANSAAGIRSANAAFVYSSAAGQGGFHAIFRFGIHTYAAGNRLFVGLSSSTAALSGSTEPSALVNMIGLGCDSGDTTLQIISNSGSGLGVKVDLGADFPINTSQTDIYELRIFVKADSSTVYWEVVRLNTGHIASGTYGSDKPASGVALAPHVHHATSVATAVAIDIMGVYIETDY